MRRDQTRRAFVLCTLLLALAVAARHVTKRGFVSTPSVQKTSVSRSLAVPTQTLDDEDRSALLRLAREALDRETLDAGSADLESSPEEPAIGVLSLSRPNATARVATAFGTDLQSAVAAAATELARRTPPEERGRGRLKLDLVVEVGDEKSLAESPVLIERSLEGLWLPEIGLLLVPEELEARRLVDSDGDFRSSRLEAYGLEQGREIPAAADSGTIDRYRRVRFDSFAESPRTPEEPAMMRLYRGNERYPEISTTSLLAAARRGGDYLHSHQLGDGSFVYSYDSKRNSISDDDNLLRRAGTCYSLVQLYRAVRDAASETEAEPYLTTARRGLAALLDDHTRPVTRPRGRGQLEAVVSPGEELKLGGSALLLLALMEYQEASSDTRWLGRAQSLARFLVAQQEEDGRFLSKVSISGKVFDFESEYYPGEAILALTRLYRVDPDPLWLETARRGADWLIGVRDADRKTRELPHDHWLLMALDQLDQLGDGTGYFEHAKRIAQAITEAQRRSAPNLDWVGSFYSPPRSTPTATRGEALVAMASLARRYGEDLTPWVQSLAAMAAFQLRCQLDEVSAMYLSRPNLTLGGFRRSLTHYEIRIDYVQHNISAFLGLRSILLLGLGTDPEAS